MSIENQEPKETVKPVSDPNRFLGIPIPIWLALIAAISAVIGGYGGHERGKAALPDNQVSLNQVNGEILSPRNGETVDNDNPNYEFECHGTVESLVPGLHLWVATERFGYIWPKNDELNPESGKWRARISERGAADKTFTVTLFVANDEAHRAIKGWLRSGEETGNYAQLEWIRGITRLDRADRLRANHKP